MTKLSSKVVLHFDVSFLLIELFQTLQASFSLRKRDFRGKNTIVSCYILCSYFISQLSLYMHLSKYLVFSFCGDSSKPGKSILNKSFFLNLENIYCFSLRRCVRTFESEGSRSSGSQKSNIRYNVTYIELLYFMLVVV